MEILWDSLDQAHWTLRVRGAALPQSWEYGVAMARLGARVGRALIRDGLREVALAQVTERRGLRLLTRGPVWLGPVTEAERRRALRCLACHAGVTVATPEERVAGMGLIPLLTPRHHAIWDLTPDPAALRAGLHGKWRNRLNGAEHLAVQRTNSAGPLQALMAAEGAQAVTRRYRALPAAFVAAWQGERMLWQWRQGGRLEAGMLLLRAGDMAAYHLGWTGEAGRAAFAHGPVLWQAALALRAEGVRRLDLGDVRADAPGLARFKLGTGAAMQPLGATVLVLP